MNGTTEGRCWLIATHRITENVLDAPGEQDLTFTREFHCPASVGMPYRSATNGVGHAVAISGRVGRANEFADLYEQGQSEVEKLRARLLLKNLIHPEGLGKNSGPHPAQGNRKSAADWAFRLLKLVTMRFSE